MRKALSVLTLTFVFTIFTGGYLLKAQFVHPGCSYSKADLDRIKEKVLAGESPWIDGWNLMIQERDAQSDFGPSVQPTIGGSGGPRQRVSRDANAAFWNTLRWYVTGDTDHADCAVRILNAYSNGVTEVASGELFQLPIWAMVQVGEILRLYPGWKEEDFQKFKDMCHDYFYPACRDFRGWCSTWPGWDGPANVSCLEIAVLLDDTTMFNEAIDYYKNGEGGGCITKHIKPSGQFSEMGRDQPHAEIGLNAYADFCQVAWNQGIDLFGYNDNLLLKGYEYFCKYNLDLPVEWEPYNDCANNNFYFPATLWENRIYGWPSFEKVYNHYNVLKDLEAPYTRAMIKLHEISNLSGTLYNLSDTTTLFDSLPTPGVPTGLKATPGVNRIILNWNVPTGEEFNVSGYNIFRSTYPAGPFTKISSWFSNTTKEYVDKEVQEGTTYYYKVSANNRTSTGAESKAVKVRAAAPTSALPDGWFLQDVSGTAAIGSIAYTHSGNRSATINGSGVDNNGGIGSYTYMYTGANGDFSIIARMHETEQNPSVFHKKVGLMMTETLSSSAKFVSVNIGDVMTRFTWVTVRSETNGSLSWHKGNTHTWEGVWFKLERIGDTFTGYISVDGETWHAVHSATVAMNDDFYAGLFVLAGSNDQNYTVPAAFDNITVTGENISVPSAPAVLTGYALNSSRIKLEWDPSSGATYYNVGRSSSESGPYEIIAYGVSDTVFADSGLVANTNYYYRVISENFSGESTDSAKATVLTPDLTLPSAPDGLEASSGNQVALLKWNYTDEAEGYIISRSLVPDGPYDSLSAVIDPKYTDNTTENTKTYYYKVAGYNKLGTGTWSSYSAVTIIKWEKLTGENIGTPGSWNNNPSTTLKAALDGNLSTYFDANIADRAWVGYDLGNNYRGIVKQIRFAPRAGQEGRAVGGVFQVSNSSDFSDATTLYKISSTPQAGVLTQAEVNISGSYRYLRYLSSWKSYGNIAEVQFYGLVDTLLPQSITFGPIADKYPDDESFDPGATATSGMVVTYTSSNPKVATIINGKVYIQKKGTCIIYANQKGNDIYGGADQVSQILKVIYRYQTITFDTIPVKLIGDGSFDAGATASSGLPIIYSSSDTSIAKILDGMVHIIKPGTCYINADQEGNSVFGPAEQVRRQLKIEGVSNSILTNQIDQIKVIPNPFSDILNVTIENELNEGISVEIIDLKGNKVLSQDFSGSKALLDMEHLSSGLYLVKILCKDRMFTRKVLKR